MAFDTKQLRTCKELVKLSKAPRYIAKGAHSYAHFAEGKIFVRFGCFYATNSYVLACVQWPEYEHAGDEEWMELSRFMDNDGKLTKFEFEPCEKQRANDFFDKHFINRVIDNSESLPFNARLMRDALMLFQINDIAPIMYNDGTRWELSGHNEDVSIKVILMGVRK